MKESFVGKQNNGFAGVFGSIKGLLFSNQNPDSYKAALSFYRNQQWEQAQALFEQAIAENNAHAPSHFKLGMCHFRQKHYKRAKRFMEKAIVLDPAQTQWKKQLAQASKRLGEERRIRKSYNFPKIEESSKENIQAPKVNDGNDNNRVIDKKPAAKRDDANPGNGEAGISKVLQHYLLSGEYEIFWDLFEVYEKESRGYVSSEILLLKNEAALMQGAYKEHFSNGCFASTRFHTAKWKAYLGRYDEAISDLQVLNTQKKKNESHYLLAQIFICLGKKEIAWELLEEVLNFSRRVMTWSYLADLVNDGADLQRYLKTLDKWNEKSPFSKYHRDVASATARAALQAGNVELAKLIWHDCLDFHLNKKGGAQKVLPSQVRYLQVPSLPNWYIPFSDLSLETALDYNGRFKQAAKNLEELFKRLNVGFYPVKGTRDWVLNRNRDTYGYQSIEIGVFEVNAFKKIKASVSNESGFFARCSVDEKILNLKGLEGVDVKVHLGTDSEASLSFEENGVLWSESKEDKFFNKLLSFAESQHLDEIESDRKSNNYSNRLSASYAWFLDIDSENISDKGAFTCYAYEAYTRALIYQDEVMETKAIRCLRMLDEHKAEYQSVLKTKYKMPTKEILDDDAPEIILYVSGLEKVGYQANMWIPVLEKFSRKSAIVLREKRTAEEIIPTNIPIYFMQTMRDLELLDNGKVKIILYPANTQKNVQTLRFYNLNHYFINHGESDKVVNQSKFLMAYDKLLVAGPLAEERLKKSGLPLREGQVVHVGRPQLEFSLKQIAQPSRLVSKILYAPTWEGFVEEANYSSVNVLGFKILHHLCKLEDVEVFFKPHPYTGYNKDGECGYYLEKIKEFARRNNNIILVDSSEDIHHYMNISDLLITDVSSVLNDYLYTLKPIILTNPRQIKHDCIYAEFPSSKAAYLVDKAENVLSHINNMTSNDPLFDTRKEVCRQSLGEFAEGSFLKFQKTILQGLE